LISGEFDALIVVYTPVGLVETDTVEKGIAAAIGAARACGAAGRPVLACLLGQVEHRMHIECAAERVPCYPFPELPAGVLSKVAAYARWQAQPPEVFPDFVDLDLGAARDVCRRAVIERGECWLSAEEVQHVLRAARLPLVPCEFARTTEEAVAAAWRIGFPVAVKLASRHFVHKTEIGGVHLGLADAEAVRRSIDEIRTRVEQQGRPEAMEGVVIQPMISGGVEVMVGVADDPHFGPLVAFGLGGIAVEVLADVCFRLAPLTDRDAAEMVRGIRGFRLLDGYRGRPPADVAALEEVLLRVSRLAEEIPEIREIDLNPIFAFCPGSGCQIADARIRVRSLSE
jgi:acyl-CoA synthetase (NDP forming)